MSVEDLAGNDFSASHELIGALRTALHNLK